MCYRGVLGACNGLRFLSLAWAGRRCAADAAPNHCAFEPTALSDAPSDGTLRLTGAGIGAQLPSGHV